MNETNDFHLVAVTLTVLTMVSLVAVGACCALIIRYRRLSRVSNRCITLSERAAFSGLSFICFARSLQKARSCYYRGDTQSAHKVLDDLEDQINELHKINCPPCDRDGEVAISCLNQRR